MRIMENKNLNETLGSFLNGLPRELQEKAKACRDTGSLVKLLSEAGIELPDELLDGVSGGYYTRNWTAKP